MVCRKGPAVDVAGCLAVVLSASHALRGPSNPDLDESPSLATLQGLVELLAEESKRAAVVNSLVCMHGLLPALLRLIQVRPAPLHSHVLRTPHPCSLAQVPRFCTERKAQVLRIKEISHKRSWIAFLVLLLHSNYFMLMMHVQAEAQILMSGSIARQIHGYLRQCMGAC